MRGSRSHPGSLIAAAAAALLVASLWSPWYSVTIPPDVFSGLGNLSQYGALGGLLQQGETLLQHLGPINLTSWDVFTVVPALLLTCAVVAGGLSLLSLSGQAQGIGRIVPHIGLVTIVLGIYRLVSNPAYGSYIHPEWGLYLAIASGAGILCGGLLESRQERAAEAAERLGGYLTPAVSVGWDAPSSVPPPNAPGT